MDFQRVFLLIIFSFSLFLLWDGWQRQNQPVQNHLNSVSAGQSAAPTPSQSLVTADRGAMPLGPVTSVQNEQVGEKITVTTDFFKAEINSIGGDISRIDLLKHFDTDNKEKPFQLFQQDVNHTYIAQSGLLGDDLPSHNTKFTTSSTLYALSEGKDSIEVRLKATNKAGINTTKIFIFHKSSYLIDIGYEIEGFGSSNQNLSAYFQLVRDNSQPVGSTVFVPTYTGPAIYTERDKFSKVEFDAIAKNKATIPKTSDNGWVGMLQHYFVSAWLPQGNPPREFYAKKLDEKLFSIGLILPVTINETTHKGTISVPLYVGPAQSKLDNIAPGLGSTVDYGILTIIAKPIFWLLTAIHSWVNNWGFAIVILTILIKLAFFPLSAASYRSMAKMRVVAPKLTKIKEQYSNDRERLNRAMMDLYKTEKINPLGGCLPVLIQIPVFISLYWSILASVEMRYAPFVGWITDLSRSDPYYVLPVIMGISMFIQSKLNPTPPDPIQAKMMQIMPIAFSVVFFFFPAGLVLYSVVNNVLSIAQQWYITRNIESESANKGVGKV
jgi:YidC/Oxa1 family membrane protein insertase